MFDERWAEREHLRYRISRELPPGQARVARALLIDAPEFEYPAAHLRRRDRDRVRDFEVGRRDAPPADRETAS
jgi:hypothetical protein